METRPGAPTRIVRLIIADQAVGQQLIGPGGPVDGPVELVLQNMLPCPAEATLAGVQPHGLVLTFAPDPADDAGPRGLVVPWGQIAYLRLLPPTKGNSGQGE